MDPRAAPRPAKRPAGPLAAGGSRKRHRPSPAPILMVTREQQRRHNLEHFL